MAWNRVSYYLTHQFFSIGFLQDWTSQATLCMDADMSCTQVTFIQIINHERKNNVMRSADMTDEWLNLCLNTRKIDTMRQHYCLTSILIEIKLKKIIMHPPSVTREVVGVSYIIWKVFESIFRNQFRLSYNLQMNSGTFFILFFDVIHQWIHLNELYKMMESFFQISN